MIHKDTDNTIVEEWSADGLQNVKTCPVCEHTQRRLLHTGLRDLLFYAPGDWSLYEYLNCGSAYPDPRPTPETSLEQVYRLLKPGGSLWIETPNINSLGHGHFGWHWRGLEPPRQIVIFSSESLSSLLKETGFNAIRMRTRRDSYRLMSARSKEKSKDPVSTGRYSKLLNWFSGLSAMLISYVRPEKAEFITLTAYKPKLEI